MKKIFFLSLTLLAAIGLSAATFYPSRTDFRDEQIYFLLPTRFYDGDPRQNLEYYGIRRAEALRDYMVQQGVDASQIKCDSKGQNEPIAPNDTRANRAKNRRAEIRFK